MTSRIFLIFLQVVVWAYFGLVLPTLAKSAAVTLPEGLRVIGTIEGKTYMADNSTKRTWTEAQTFCKDSGMRLATITTTIQADFLRRQWSAFAEWHWIGGRDKQTIDQFAWDHTNNTVQDIVTQFTFVAGLNVCLRYLPGTSPNGHIAADFCTTHRPVLCEIAHGYDYNLDTC